MTTIVERPAWLGPDTYPFTPRRLDLDGDTVAYVDEGTGPVLLFVHLGLWSYVFRDVIVRLRSDFRCITLDPPGFGLSPTPGDGEALGYDELSELLGRFVDALGLEHITLVAHDLGGPASVAMAGPRADRIAGLVVVNTFLWEPDRRALRTMFRLMGSRTLTALGAATNLIPRLSSGRVGVGRQLDAASRAAFLGPYRERDRRRRFHTTMRSAFEHPEVTRRAERVATTVLRRTPVLTVFGERNDPFGFQARHASVFDDHEGLVIPGGNHFPMADDPERFADAVRDWHHRKVDRA